MAYLKTVLSTQSLTCLQRTELFSFVTKVVEPHFYWLSTNVFCLSLLGIAEGRVDL